MDRTERRAAVKFSILRSKSARYGLSTRIGCKQNFVKNLIVFSLAEHPIAPFFF